MRMIEIAIFLLIFNVFISYSVNNNLFANDKFGSANPSIDDSYLESLNQSNTSSGSVGFDPFGFTQATSFFTTTLNAVTFVISTIYGATIALPSVMGQMLGGSPEAISIGFMLAFPIWAVYLIGLMQFLRGVGTKGMD
jgi:hypothetical protein